MLYLGIDQHAKQLTIDLSNEDGDLVLHWDQHEYRRRFRHISGRRLGRAAIEFWRFAKCDPARHGMFLNRGVHRDQDFAEHGTGREYGGAVV